MTVTSKLHTQEDRDTELNVVIDEVGPGEGRLESWGIEVPFNPAGEGGVAQVPAGSPAQATTCGQSAPVTEVACQDEDWERVIRSPPPDRANPSRAMGPVVFKWYQCYNQDGRRRFASHTRPHPGQCSQGSPRRSGTSPAIIRQDPGTAWRRKGNVPYDVCTKI